MRSQVQYYMLSRSTDKNKGLVRELCNKVYIGEYSAKIIHFFPLSMKKLLKVSLYFSFSGIEKCPNVHFLGKIYTFLIKIGTIGGVKSIKIYTYEISPLSYFFPSILPLNISEFLDTMPSIVDLFLCKLFNI